MVETIKRSMKDHAAIRWGILILIASVQAANYYFYDAISPLKRLLEDNFNFTSGDFGLYVAAYSIPNTFLLMAVLGGIILDKLGIRRTGFLFVGLMASGGLITAYGASEYFSNGGFLYGFFNSFLTDYSPQLKMMLLGRFLFGLGAETSIVVVSKVIVKWFKGKELALAFGVKIGLARAGSALALYYSASIAEAASHWTIAIWFAAIMLLIAFLAFLVYSFFDIRIDRQTNQEVSTGKSDDFSWLDLKELLTNRSFIFVTLLCVTFYSAVFPFQAFSPDFLLNKFGMGMTKSGEIASILYWVTMFATPLFGFVVDKYGRSASLMIFGSILLALIHLTFALTYFNPVIPLVLLGIAIALVPAAMWPSVAKIVVEKRIGTAYGAMFSIQNFGLFLFPILVGVILDSTNKNAEIFIFPKEVKEISLTKDFSGKYLNNRNEAIKNKELLASTYIYKLDENVEIDSSDIKNQIQNSATLIWNEYFNLKSDNDGLFKSRLGSDSVERINLANFKLFNKEILVSFSTDDDKYRTDSVIKIEKLATDFLLFKSSTEKIHKQLTETKTLKVSLTDYTDGELILTESHDLFIDEEGYLKFKIGNGKIKYANIDYLNWTKNTIIKIKTPLNYTYAILLFATLGLLGFIFALLLKREDKVSGYGLELPSNVKAKKTK